MKIIDELARTSVKKNKKDTFATKISILMAVVLLGTIIFIIFSLRTDEYKYVKNTIGDYHVSISQIDENIYDYIEDWDKVERLEYTKFIDTGKDSILYLESENFWKLDYVDIKKGRKAGKPDEIIVTDKFLKNNHKYGIDSNISIKDRNYKIVGVFEDLSFSFEDTFFYGLLSDTSKENLLDKDDALLVRIWYKSPRDTYSNTRELLEKFNIDAKKAESIGRLYYNTSLLEYWLIYPSGIIPPKDVILSFIEVSIPIFLLMMLFAMMIYNAFNVWNNREIKEIALLKSAGMTEKQVKKMIKKKVMKVSVLPILMGAVISYGVANLLTYLMWINYYISYKNINSIYEQKGDFSGFYLIKFSPIAFVIIVFLSLITVYLSSIVPAKKSGKISIIDGLRGDISNKKKFGLGKSKISLKIEKSLAKDYLKSYRKTYRAITISMVIAALSMSLVLTSQSYRELEIKYNSKKDNYNLSSTIFTDGSLNKNLIEDIKKLANVDELHIYSYKTYKFFLDDNSDVISDEMDRSIKEGMKTSDSERYYLTIYGFEKEDFDNILKENNLEYKDNMYILLNKTCLDENVPYQMREYIPLVKDDKTQISARYSMEDDLINIPIADSIYEFPYELQSYDKREVSVFTTMENLEELILKTGKDKNDPVNYHQVKLKTKSDLNMVTDDYLNTIYKYITKRDHNTSNDILKEAYRKEQIRNEHFLNLGIQMIFLIIALSNAYNSFHGNLRARKKDFQLLISAGMTEKQINKMISLEGFYLLRNVSIVYILPFFSIVFIKSYRNKFMFKPLKIIGNINFVPIILLFAITTAGIFFAVNSGRKSIVNEDIMEGIKEI